MAQSAVLHYVEVSYGAHFTIKDICRFAIWHAGKNWVVTLYVLTFQKIMHSSTKSKPNSLQKKPFL